MPYATSAQRMVADRYRIPYSQAHTVNLKKFERYIKWLWSGAGKVERALDKMQEQQMWRWKSEWL